MKLEEKEEEPKRMQVKQNKKSDRRENKTELSKNGKKEIKE
jgi:hypothetical protein